MISDIEIPFEHINEMGEIINGVLFTSVDTTRGLGIIRVVVVVASKDKGPSTDDKYLLNYTNVSI